MRTRRWLAWASCAAILLSAAPVLARQDAPSAAQPDPPAQAPAPERSAFMRFMRDVAGDYAHIVSGDSAAWYAGGAAAAGLTHFADEAIRSATQDPAEPVTLALEAG